MSGGTQLAPEALEMLQAAVGEPGALDERQPPQPGGTTGQVFDA